MQMDVLRGLARANALVLQTTYIGPSPSQWCPARPDPTFLVTLCPFSGESTPSRMGEAAAADASPLSVDCHCHAPVAPGPGCARALLEAPAGALSCGQWPG